VPGAYYADQGYRLWDEGRYGWSIASHVASFAEAGLGVFTLGQSTRYLAAQRAASTAVRGVVAAESRALVPYFPVANGFLGATSRSTLQAGTVIDRYGGTAVSRFFSPAGTPLGARALPPETAAQGLRSFEVVKALEVEAGTVAPAFGQLGLGTQYRTSLTLSELVEQGFIREVVR